MSESRNGSPSGADTDAPVPTTSPETPGGSTASGSTAGARSMGSPDHGIPAHGTPPAYGTPPVHGTPPAYDTPPVYGTPPGHAVAPAAMGAAEERNWAVGAHLSGFVAAYAALGFIGPLVVVLAVGNRSAYVRRHAVEALNFNLSVLLYAVVSAVLVLILIGIPMLAAVALLYLVATIQGALAASRGQEFRYPLTIRFIS